MNLKLPCGAHLSCATKDLVALTLLLSVRADDMGA